MTAQRVQPKLIIHGGAGSSLRSKGSGKCTAIAAQSFGRNLPLLLSGVTAQEAVVKGCQLLEDDPRFNAGTGSVLQSDGQIRMSAALMNGVAQRFSGVINVSRVQNPIRLALALQESTDRVLSDFGAAELLRELELPPYNPLTDIRLQEWMQERSENFEKEMAGVIAEKELVEDTARRGTIGVVALDDQGRLAVGTSTGGKGFERIGRVSDSAMPAGNYATAEAAVSCTGIGEDIIDECLAPRIVIRAVDGLPLQTAFERSLKEANRNQRDLGAIGLDATGAIAWGKTSEVLLAAYHTGDAVGDTLEWEEAELVGGFNLKHFVSDSISEICLMSISRSCSKQVNVYPGAPLTAQGTISWQF